MLTVTYFNIFNFIRHRWFRWLQYSSGPNGTWRVSCHGVPKSLVALAPLPPEQPGVTGAPPLLRIWASLERNNWTSDWKRCTAKFITGLPDAAMAQPAATSVASACNRHFCLALATHGDCCQGLLGFEQLVWCLAAASIFIHAYIYIYISFLMLSIRIPSRCCSHSREP